MELIKIFFIKIKVLFDFLLKFLKKQPINKGNNISVNNLKYNSGNNISVNNLKYNSGNNFSGNNFQNNSGNFTINLTEINTNNSKNLEDTFSELLHSFQDISRLFDNDKDKYFQEMQKRFNNLELYWDNNRNKSDNLDFREFPNTAMVYYEIMINYYRVNKEPTKPYEDKIKYYKNLLR